MKPAPRPISGAVVIGGLVVIAIAVWWLRGTLEPAAPAPSPPPAPPRDPPAAAAPSSSYRSSQLPGIAPAAPAPRAELHGHDMADPCLPAGDPTIPAGYTTITASDVTVAWSPDRPSAPGPTDVELRATSLAYLTSGLIAEAAGVTTTFPRASLTVVVYPASEFTAQTGLPAWADGAYDGAVRVPAMPRSELGVSLATLRHEVMHAQLHAAIGCLPAWFNEGTAMYFAGSVPVLDWLKVMRAHDSLDLAGVQGGAFAEMTAERAARAYGTSLAMVLFAIDGAQGQGVVPAVRALQAIAREKPRAGLELWDRMFPRVDDRAVLDFVAHKLFSAGLGPALDDKLRGAVCCYGLRSPGETTCAPAALRPGSRLWTDRVGSRVAMCFGNTDAQR